MITYPIDAAAFLTALEHRKRSLAPWERETYTGALEAVNAAYRDGLEGTTTGLYPKRPALVWEEMRGPLEDQGAASPEARQFIISWCGWCNRAWEQGRQNAQTENRKDEVKMKFPMDAETCITFCEVAAGAPLSPDLRRRLAEQVEAVNAAYENGRKGEPTTFYPLEGDQLEAQVEQLMGSYPPALGSPDEVRHFARTLWTLCTKAWEQGRQDAQGEGGATCTTDFPKN